MFLTPGSRAKAQSFPSLLLRRFPRSQPHAPSDGVELFAQRRAGRQMAAQIGPSGSAYELQPYWGGKKIGLATTVGAGSTTINSLGWGAPSPSGTATTRSIATTSLFAGARRAGYVLASAAANLATGWSVAGGTAIAWRGNAAGRGGFFLQSRFGFTTLTAGNRHMVGFANSGTTTADPSAATSCCFIGKDAADTNWQVMFNDGAGTCTKVDTGLAPVVDRVYDVFVFAAPAANSITLALVRYDDTGAVDQVFEYVATADLPPSTTQMAALVMSGSGSATTGAQIDIIGTYFETDF